MKNNGDIDHQIAYWKPALIELTMIGNPDVNDGKPMSTFVDPSMIQLIYASLSAFNKPDGTPHERVECTTVQLYSRDNIPVLESCAEVAMRRDRALGHTQVPKAVT